MRRGSAPETITRATRLARVLVLPEPAPAMMSSGGVSSSTSAPCSTARRCSALSLARYAAVMDDRLRREMRVHCWSKGFVRSPFAARFWPSTKHEQTSLSMKKSDDAGQGRPSLADQKCRCAPELYSSARLAFDRQTKSGPKVARARMGSRSSLPCKSHDRPTGCELSWDYRGICPSQRK